MIRYNVPHAINNALNYGYMVVEIQHKRIVLGAFIFIDRKKVWRGDSTGMGNQSTKCM